jgi:hypothetical protein
MLLSQRFEKMESRDSVFAILGLVERDKLATVADPSLLRVDYTKTLPDVLRDATRYALCQAEGLEVLSLAEPCSDQTENVGDFPSWAARIDLRRGIRDLCLLPRFYHASSGLDPQPLLADTTYGAEVLLVEGIVVAQVTQANPIFPDGLLTFADLHSGLRIAKATAVRHCSPAFREYSIQDCTSLASAITAATASGLTRAQPEDMNMLSSYLAHLDINEDDPVSILPHDIEKLRHINQSVDLHKAVGRQVFVTSESSIGLGPISMQANDIVVVLRGGVLPFILRKVSRFYQLIGPAYVHDIMDGEAVETSKAKNEPEILFPLR